ncbi:glycosyltransferase involved in cell wall biosynthesis [Streptacidiphilus sp. MAP12-16]|uniref:DUF3492 domain-containing protein n=1 Tax=Streptacidiphilus sp. MAP12-16 TaxID=3156300 RepID=UPI003515D698
MTVRITRPVTRSTQLRLLEVSMRIALLTESAFPRAKSAEGGWCDRLTRGLPEHEFEMYALGATRRDPLPEPLPDRLFALRHGAPSAGMLQGRGRRRALTAYQALVRSLVEPGAAAEFGPALYALAEAGRGGGLPALLRSGAALRLLEAAWQEPGAVAARGSGSAAEPLVRDALVAADLLERCLRPLSASWYEPADGYPRRLRWPWAQGAPSAGGPAGGRSGGRSGGLAAVDLCHAVDGGLAVLPGLLAKHFYGIPLIITEHSLHLRERARGYRSAPYRRPVRALLLTFFRLLAREGYQQAGLITPGSSYDQRWQIHCGADPAAIRVVYEGTENADHPPVGAEPEIPALAWSGPMEPHGGLDTMLRAFAELRAEPEHAEVRLRVHGETSAVDRTGPAEEYQDHCRRLARELFPAEPGAPAAVCFEGRPARLRTVHEGGTVVVFSGTEGPPPTLLAEAMLSGRPVVATDVGAAREVVGPAGLLVPADDPRALATACSALLADQERRLRLGNAGRLRAQELYAVEPAAAAFRELYLELVSHWPGQRAAESGLRVACRPFSRTAEAWVAAESRTGGQPTTADRMPPRPAAPRPVAVGAAGAASEEAGAG